MSARGSLPEYNRSEFVTSKRAFGGAWAVWMEAGRFRSTTRKSWSCRQFETLLICRDCRVLSRQRSASPKMHHTLVSMDTPLLSMLMFRRHSRSSSFSRGTPSPSSSGRYIAPTIPPHVVEIEEKPVSADVIAAYPSSHLNTDPAPLPSTSPSGYGGSHVVSGATGLTAPMPQMHRHHSSFDKPIDSSPIYVPGADTSALSGSAVETGSPARTHSPLRDSTTPAELAQHPTVAETGVPIVSHNPGPAKGQLERREPARGDDIVKLGSFGSADAPKPNVGAPDFQRQSSMPGAYGGYEEGEEGASQGVPPAYSSEHGHEQPQHKVYAPPPPMHQGGVLPPPQHPATLGAPGHAPNAFPDPTAADLQGMTPREQAEYQLRQKGYQAE